MEEYSIQPLIIHIINIYFSSYIFPPTHPPTPNKKKKKTLDKALSISDLNTQ